MSQSIAKSDSSEGTKSIIEAKNITKYYGHFKALDNLNLTVPKGSIFALLGPNGAGKTSFVKSVLGLVRPSQGEILLNGLSSLKKEARLSVSYLPEKFSFYSYYKVKSVLEFYGEMHGLDKGQMKQSVERNLKRLGIFDIKDKRVDKISKGQLQRTGIASVLMGETSFIIFDEPFSGLDPIGIKEVKDLFLELKKEGKTLFINSHILSEMEQVCDSMAILNKGKLLVEGPLSDLIGQQSLEDYFYQQIKSEN